MSTDASSGVLGLEISAQNLTYKHTPDVEPSLVDISFQLPKGSRTILIGANGGMFLFFDRNSKNGLWKP